MPSRMLATPSRAWLASQSWRFEYLEYGIDHSAMATGTRRRTAIIFVEAEALRPASCSAGSSVFSPNPACSS